MSKYLIAAALLFSLQSFAGDNEHHAVIWRGFQHKWTYNHRCNRIGDYVTEKNGQAISTHTSATGIGADSTLFQSNYSYVESPGIFFKEGKVNIKIAGKEKRLMEGILNVRIPCGDSMKAKDRYLTLFNGFNLLSEEAADKIQLFKVSIEDAEYLNATNELQFNIHYNIVFNCQSIECPEFNNRVTYDLDLYYLIAAYNESDAAYTLSTASRAYSWDRKEELNEIPEEKTINGQGLNTFPNATIGIKEFEVVLNEAHWLLELNNAIAPMDYDPYSGSMRLSADLLFKEWQEGMKANSAVPNQSKFSAKRKGWALLNMGIVLLQMKNARIYYAQRQGGLFWKGGNESAKKPEAVNEVPISFEPGSEIKK